ncbi:MAG TPA: hypothetical protein VMU83_24685 [Hanamia sp.]|nr:hypothetical protein [Hanamia sp.]
MRSKLKIVICLLVFFITKTETSYAQDKDSTNQVSSDVEKPYKPEDSLLDLNQSGDEKISFDDSDKILKWKSNREFAYIHYLDSLLRKQKDIKADTVSINENSGKIIRNHKPGNQVLALNKILNSTPLKIFFWVLAIIFIGFAGYKVFFKNRIFAFKRNKIIANDEEGLPADLDDFSKYDALISEAENKNDFNMATRYLYLKSLKSLSEREFINYSPDKTNQDYVNEMKPNNYFNEFQSLTRNYEYLWYGKFLIDEKKYQILKEKFILFNKKV